MQTFTLIVVLLATALATSSGSSLRKKSKRQINGCVYKGNTYQQGQTWNDGCATTCACQDASRGAYRCTSNCPTYQSLPSACKLKTTPGECCAKPDCNFQGITGGSFTGSGTGSGSTGSGSAPVSQACTTDKIPTCNQYSRTICQATEYRQWAAENCCIYCGISYSYTGTDSNLVDQNGHYSGGPSQGGSVGCRDSISNCVNYTMAICHDVKYSEWVLSNCPAFCGLCYGMTGGTGSMTGGTGSMTGGTGSFTGGTGSFTGGSGTGTGGTFTGGTGTGTGGTMTGGTGSIMPGGSYTVVCQDKVNCANYGKTTCQSQQYAQWVRENCPVYCGICGSMTGGSGTGTGTMPGGTGTITGGTGTMPGGTGTITGGTGTITGGTGTIPGGTGTLTGGTGTMPGGTGTITGGTGTMPGGTGTITGGTGTMPGGTGTITGGTGTMPGGTGTITGGTGTMTGQCTDTISNCKDYAADICTDASYRDWARQNCAGHCKFCGGTGTMPGGTGTITGGTGTMPGGTGTMPGGTGTITGGTGTMPGGTGTITGGTGTMPGGTGGTGTITGGTGTMPGGTGTITGGTGGTGTMSGGSGTMTGPCADALSNCASYDKSTCTDVKFSQWAKANCARTCNMCSSGGSGTGTGSTGTMTGTNCHDSISNCAQLDQTRHICTDAGAQMYAKQNCPLTCNLCSSVTGGMTGGMTGGNTGGMTGGNTGGMTGGNTGGMTGGMTGGTTYTTCTDTMSNCKDYGSAVCSKPEYSQWVKSNCAGFCQICGSMSGGTGTMTGGTGTMTGGTGPMTGGTGGMTGGTGSGSTSNFGTHGGFISSGNTMSGQSSGCYHNGQAYQQGQKWRDGCKFECTCVDASKGQYQCTSLCATWNLQPQCHLEQPAPGKCCPTPSCPAGIQIRYPPNYVAN